jgi:hypothetical protein
MMEGAAENSMDCSGVDNEEVGEGGKAGSSSSS